MYFLYVFKNLITDQISNCHFSKNANCKLIFDPSQYQLLVFEHPAYPQTPRNIISDMIHMSQFTEHFKKSQANIYSVSCLCFYSFPSTNSNIATLKASLYLNFSSWKIYNEGAAMGGDNRSLFQESSAQHAGTINKHAHPFLLLL